MAKSGFWLRGSKGKLAGTVLYQSQGSTIQREIVTPKNPQSDNQMRQRAAFAGASKFYQNAQQNRFVLAFQNKKGNQSEFNAFMQKNLREFDTLNFPTREQANTPEFCNYFPWICTEGSLQGIPVAWPDDNMAALGAKIKINNAANWTSWEQLIAANPTLNLQYGDIITLTCVFNDMVASDGSSDIITGNLSPIWVNRQLIIGADLEGNTILQYLNINGFSSLTDSESSDDMLAINMEEPCEQYGINGGNFVTTEVAAMICVTRSRREGSQLKVSSSRFYLDDMAQRIFERLSNDTQMRDAIASYKASTNSRISPENILQGSVAEDFIKVTSIRYRNSAGENVTERVSKLSGITITPNPDIPGVKTSLVYIRTKSEVDKSLMNIITSEGGSSAISSEDGNVNSYRVQINYASSATGNKTFSISLQGVEIVSGTVALGS